MEEQVATSSNVLAQMKDAADSMRKLKECVEDANAIKNEGEKLFKDLSDAKYGKVVLDISEKISGISFNPSDYIAHIDWTKNLQRRCSFSCYREKALLGMVDSFTDGSSNFLSTKPPKNLNTLCADIQKELRRSDQIKIASKEANNRLMPVYKRTDQKPRGSK
ncbi:hypothetical protein [Cardinium endosymbiont of Nabis limbatus]|uniref:hypothetical protein n=1 Tax=Cardinium endosymbiont of Nabis limbatus TaxID=3066217 RepID=UPI003AF3FBE1